MEKNTRSLPPTMERLIWKSNPNSTPPNNIKDTCFSGSQPWLPNQNLGSFWKSIQKLRLHSENLSANWVLGLVPYSSSRKDPLVIPMCCQDWEPTIVWDVLLPDKPSNPEKGSSKGLIPLQELLTEASVYPNVKAAKLQTELAGALWSKLTPQSHPFKSCG